GRIIGSLGVDGRPSRGVEFAFAEIRLPQLRGVCSGQRYCVDQPQHTENYRQASHGSVSLPRVTSRIVAPSAALLAVRTVGLAAPRLQCRRGRSSVRSSRERAESWVRPSKQWTGGSGRAAPAATSGTANSHQRRLGGEPIYE